MVYAIIEFTTESNAFMISYFGNYKQLQIKNDFYDWLHICLQLLYAPPFSIELAT